MPGTPTVADERNGAPSRSRPAAPPPYVGGVVDDSGDDLRARFPIRFTGANRAMAVIGLLPGSCSVEVTDEAVAVRMGWAFRASIPRSSIRAVRDDHDRVGGWGAHGWRGTWLVNGPTR